MEKCYYKIYFKKVLKDKWRLAHYVRYQWLANTLVGMAKAGLIIKVETIYN